MVNGLIKVLFQEVGKQEVETLFQKVSDPLQGSKVFLSCLMF